MSELFECCLWYNAAIPGERRAAKDGIRETFFRTGVVHAKKFGVITFEDLEPDDARLPAPPDHMKGKLRCLYGSAPTLSDLEHEAGVTGDFTDEDLTRMRHATRVAYFKACGEWLTDDECDSFINEYVPEVIEDEIIGK